MPEPQDDRERDVEHHEVEQRVEQRPREPEDAVLVLDLQLVADHADEQLAALDDPGEPLPCGHPRPHDRRFARGARHSSLAARTCGSRYSVGQPQPGADRAVIRRRLRQDLAAERLDTAAHEDVIDLAVRAARRAGAAAHRAVPARASTPPTGGPQKLKSPARICGPPSASPRRSVSRCCSGASRHNFDDVCSPTTSTGVPSIATVERERVARPGRIAPDRAHRDQPAIEHRETRADARAPTCRRAARVARALFRRARPQLEPHQLDRLDVVAVVAQRVEHADAVRVAPRLGHDDEVGVEAAHDRARRRSGRPGTGRTGRLPSAR